MTSWDGIDYATIVQKEEENLTLDRLIDEIEKKKNPS